MSLKRKKMAMREWLQQLKKISKWMELERRTHLLNWLVLKREANQRSSYHKKEEGALLQRFNKLNNQRKGHNKEEMMMEMMMGMPIWTEKAQERRSRKIKMSSCSRKWTSINK